MQFKKVVVITAVFGVAALAANGCSSNKANGTDGGDTGVTGLDAKSEKTPTGDSGDSGGCFQSVSCEVCDQSTYVPAKMGSPIQTLHACTTADMNAYVAACFPPGTQAECTAWYAADSGACTTCLGQTMQTAATWGAIICGSSTCQLNTGDCLDLVLGTVSSEKINNGSGSCGDAVTAAFGCEDAACSTCMDPDFTTCVTNTETMECAQYYNTQTTACPTTDAGQNAFGICNPQSTATFVNLLDVYCGTGTGTPS